MATIEATRTIGADPAGLALLLAGPTAAEIFTDGTALEGAGVEVQITPPRRTGIGFAASLRALSAGRLVGSASISIQPAVGEGCRISVLLRPSERVNAAALAQWLQRGLDDLAAAAHERSFAA